MEEQLISFEIAKLAKEKGFELDKYLSIDDENPKNLNSNYNPRDYQPWYFGLTQSLLQKWLREVHNIHINPIPYSVTFKETVYRCRITYFEDKMEQNKYIGLSIYENAFEIGLQEALKLIK